MRATERRLGRFLNRFGLGMRAKLIIIFLVVKVIPIIILSVIAWRQITYLGSVLREIAVEDSSAALNDSAVENIERLTTDTAIDVAEFLYARDADLLALAELAPSAAAYQDFLDSKQGRLIKKGEWALAENGQSWVRVDAPVQEAETGTRSTNTENNDNEGFRYRQPDPFEYEYVPLYDEITFVGLDGMERIKVQPEVSRKINHPLSKGLTDVSKQENTFVKAETYFERLQNLQPGEIYVSDVIGAYVGSNYIGMYTPDIVKKAAGDRGYDIPYAPEQQAYAGMENPNGERFEGIVRFATPVAGSDGSIIGYVTFALNHDHIMELVDHVTPMRERYTELPSAYEGNYAFIWDYQCRSICHPRHHSIVGYNAETGEEQIPWLETSIYEGWKASGIERWTDYIKDKPTFHEQSREKKPAPILTQQGLVGLDGRYLDNAPQCTGWMDLTADGGSGSFYILWSGLYKLTTAAAIPYYTGQYAPSEDNGFSRRGFGIVTIGAGLEDFRGPATETEIKLTHAIEDNLRDTSAQLITITVVIITLVVLIAIWIASSLTGSITTLIAGISRFRAGERQFRFNDPVKDEFGTLADSFDDMADSIAASVKNPLTITDMDGTIIYMNECGLDFCNLTLEETVGTNYAKSSVYPPGSPYYPITALEEGREADIFFLEERGRYLRGIANYFLSKEGEKLGYIIESMDMTDVVLQQLKTEEQRQLLDKVFSASPDLIWYTDGEGRYLTVNPRFAAMAGGPAEEFAGKTAEETLPTDIAGGFIENDHAALAGRKPFYAEERVTFQDGHEEILDSVRTPLYDASGALIGMLGFARDVSRRVDIEAQLRNTQLELEKAVEAANEANSHKGEFLARMSHEIRTPMNAIIGITNIVQKRLYGMEGEPFDEVKGRIDQIEVSSQHLLGLLNDILDISKIEAGKIELSEEVLEINRLFRTVDGIIRPRCDEKNITFVTELDAFSPSTFLSDSLRLRQVLINLLGNAVKFTPECGTIIFSVKNLEQKGDGKALIGFSVKDTGIGISEAAKETIFQPFEQGNAKVSRKFGGTGLGLAISRNIVRLFGGDIEVISVEGEGSEFRFQIYLKETEALVMEEHAITDVTGRFDGKRLLLVDDVEINRVIVASMLENTGMDIVEADDGEAAVRAFESAPEGYFDIILMDVQMPVMDGYEASAAIRALDRVDARSIPIVALTANAFKEDMDRALQHGMNAHVAKPVEIDTLYEVLVQYLG